MVWNCTIKIENYITNTNNKGMYHGHHNYQQRRNVSWSLQLHLVLNVMHTQSFKTTILSANGIPINKCHYKQPGSGC